METIDTTSLLVGLIIGVVLGIVMAWFNARKLKSNANEHENQALNYQTLLQNTGQFLAENKSTIHRLRQDMDELHQKIQQQEETFIQLKSGIDGTERSTFFGQHASEFLKTNVPNHTQAESGKEYQPQDFSERRSGLWKTENGSSDGRPSA